MRTDKGINSKVEVVIQNLHGKNKAILHMNSTSNCHKHEHTTKSYEQHFEQPKTRSRTPTHQHILMYTNLRILSHTTTRTARQIPAPNGQTRKGIRISNILRCKYKHQLLNPPHPTVPNLKNLLFTSARLLGYLCGKSEKQKKPRKR